MAVVWGTVKDHGGYIDVKTTFGLGTIFTLYFPIIREKINKQKIPLSMSEYIGNGESILIIDDIEGQRIIASDMLKKLGYSAVSVASGEKALKFLETNKVDLVIIDMIMDPGIDGCETYRRILQIHPGQKAIITSGFSETERVKKAQNIGAGEYIKKPYTFEKLGLAVKKALQQQPNNIKV